VDYTFKHGKYMALNGGFADGGGTYLNGVKRQDWQKNWRIGITFSTPVFNVHQSVILMFNTGGNTFRTKLYSCNNCVSI
jgi:hypothetical protein